MVAPVPPEGNTHPNQELGPELRQAVEAVLHDEVPPDWAEETLDKFRRLSPRTAPRKSRRFAYWISLAAAACIVAIVLLGRSWLSDDGREVVKNPPDRPKEAPPSVQSDVVQPTLWAYRQAARQSPETLDELLDRHAGQLLHRPSETDPGALWRELL